MTIRAKERPGNSCIVSYPLTLSSPTRERGVCGSHFLRVPIDPCIANDRGRPTGKPAHEAEGSAATSVGKTSSTNFFSVGRPKSRACICSQHLTIGNLYRLLAVPAILLSAASTAAARPATWPNGFRSGQPNPAVVRVVAPEADGHSHGSGTLVAVRGNVGLVVTNWHVVREARGTIVVVFPEGFSSGASVLATDRVWDLAALVVWRPAADPLPVAESAPRLGELLTIAGYGPGWYRAATGRCTQYVSPGRNQPFEMVELSVPAREGDSGGPILNERGELAGVLFGATRDATTGSYCGRVRRFLESFTGNLDRLDIGPTLIAKRPPPECLPPAKDAHPDPENLAALGRPSAAPTAAILARTTPSIDQSSVMNKTPWHSAPADSREQGEPDSNLMRNSGNPGQLGSSDDTQPLDRLKGIFAVIGLIAVIFHSLRLLGSLHAE